MNGMKGNGGSGGTTRDGALVDVLAPPIIWNGLLPGCWNGLGGWKGLPPAWNGFGNGLNGGGPLRGGSGAAAAWAWAAG